MERSQFIFLCLALTSFIQGCNIIPEDATTEFPNTADYGGLTYTNVRGEVYEASISIERDEYIVDWGNRTGIFKLNQAVAFSRVTTSEDKLLSVKHFSVTDSLLQSIDITYKDQEFESIIINSPGKYIISDTFFYKDSKLDSIAREIEYNSGAKEKGFLKNVTSFSLDGSLLIGDQSRRFLFVQNYLDTPANDLNYPEAYFQYILENNANYSLILETSNIDLSYQSSYFNSPYSSNFNNGYSSSNIIFEPLSNKVSSYSAQISHYESPTNLYFNSLMLIPCKLIYQEQMLLDMLYRELFSGNLNSASYYYGASVEFKMTYAHE